MRKSNIGTAFTYAYFFLFIAIIGICFSAFVIKDNQVKVESIFIKADDDILVQKKDEKGNMPISKLTIMSSKVGLKPASGELDTQSDIPFTITDKVGSEGAWACFSVKSEMNWEVKILKVEGVAEKDLKNVKIAFDNERAYSLSDLETPLISKKGSSKQKNYTVFVWLDTHVSNKIVGSNIKIWLGFQTL